MLFIVVLIEKFCGVEKCNMQENPQKYQHFVGSSKSIYLA